VSGSGCLSVIEIQWQSGLPGLLPSWASELYVD